MIKKDTETIRVTCGRVAPTAATARIVKSPQQSGIGEIRVQQVEEIEAGQSPTFKKKSAISFLRSESEAKKRLKYPHLVS